MTKFLKRFCIITASLLFGSIVAYPLNLAAALSSRHGGRLVLDTTSDPKSFNGMVSKETSTREVTEYVFEGLTTIDPHTAEVKPLLAHSWEVDDTGLIWIFHLRRDVLWNDGRPFTASDVDFTFNDLVFNEDVATSLRDILKIDGQFMKVEAVDDYTVRFILPVKYAPFLRMAGIAIYPRHILEPIVKEKAFNYSWGIDTPPEQIVGTGPFRFVRYDPGQRLVFQRNPFYWKKDADGASLPYFDEIVKLILQNQDVTLLKFMEGSLDVIGLRGADFALLKPLEDKQNFTVYNLGAQTGSNFLLFNRNTGRNPETDEPYVAVEKQVWFQDQAFLTATAHAIDKDKIIEIVLNGLGFPQHAAIGPGGGFFHNPDVVKYEYDLDKARQILTDAGYIDRDGDGIIEDKNGFPVKFNLSTNTGATVRKEIAAIIRHDLESLGMSINFQPLEFNTLVSKLTGRFDWEAMVMGLTGGQEPHFGKSVWSSEGHLHMWHPLQKKPATAWEKRIDMIFNEGVKELDPKKRKKLYNEFQLIVSQELPLIYTVLSARISAVRNTIQNLDPSQYGGLLHNIEELYLERN